VRGNDVTEMTASIKVLDVTRTGDLDIAETMLDTEVGAPLLLCEGAIRKLLLTSKELKEKADDDAGRADAAANGTHAQTTSLDRGHSKLRIQQEKIQCPKFSGKMVTQPGRTPG